LLKEGEREEWGGGREEGKGGSVSLLAAGEKRK